MGAKVRRPKGRCVHWMRLGGWVAVLWFAGMLNAQEPLVPVPGPQSGQEAPAQPAPAETPVPTEDEAARELLQLEQLLQQPAVAPALEQVVTTVARQESTVGRSPAAVFVITNEMIRRSGATTIAEALRMVPGMNVARIDNANWAISARGFAGRFADKLLVQIDGRTVYNPLFSGVFWQGQDLLLQDVERIEVIRGPGASVWGANAVNGVINIITKNAQDTPGTLVMGGGGSEEAGFSGLRYGGRTEDDTLHYRIWGKWREVDHGFNSDGESREDWRAGRGGFRIDWTPDDANAFMLQGDLFGIEEGLLDKAPTPVAPPFFFNRVEDRRHSGGDVVGRWTHTIDPDSNWSLQLYYNNYRLDQVRFDHTEHDTFDLDFQHEFLLTERQQIVWGLGYRLDRVFLGQSPDPDGFEVRAFPPQRDIDLFSAFVQDTITLVDDRWFFTVGSKFIDYELTGFEYQPTGRLLWTPTERQSVWGAVSRAIRTPNFGEHHSRSTLIPAPPGIIFPRVIPNPGLQSEELMAYELGFRAQPTNAFSWDLALFFNKYRRLRTLVAQGGVMADPGPPAFSFLPLEFQNRMDGETYGVELSANYSLTESWRLYGAYTFLQMQLHADGSLPAGTRAAAEAAERQSPQNQFYLWLSGDIACNWQVDLIGRYVDHLSGFAIPVGSYIQMDVRLGWEPRPNLEFAVVGQNLLDSHHLEFGGNPLVGRPLIEAQRGVYGMVTYLW